MEFEDECRLGDLADLVRGVAYKPSALLDSNQDGGIPLLRATNIGAQTLVLQEVLHVPQHLVKPTQYLQKFDVVIAMSSGSRAAVGRLAQLRREWFGTFGAFCGAIRPLAEKVDPEYLGYLLYSPDFRARIETYAAGTAIMNLSREHLLGFPIRLPKRPHQRAIAYLLGSIDDRIDLLRQTNATLEGIAQALFRSWFVDFDPVRAKADGREPDGVDAATAALFPAEFEESELGAIPKGWRVSRLDSLANFTNGLALQKYPPESDDEYLPVIKIAQLRAGSTVGSDRASAQLKPDYVVRDGDVLFSWSGSLEVEFWCGGDGALNQHLFKVTSRDVPKWCYYLATRHFLPRFREIAADKATTMGHIQRKHLSEARIALPPEDLLNKAGEVIGALLERRVAASLQARELANLRDLLLPRLISGALRLPEAEAQIDEAIA
jgi:type I restriction enzyme S subunit